MGVAEYTTESYILNFVGIKIPNVNMRYVSCRVLGSYVPIYTSTMDSNLNFKFES